MSDNRYWHPDETQDADRREAALMAALPAFVAHTQKHCAAYRHKLRDVDATKINSRAALAELPVTRKSDLITEQMLSPPFGNYNCFSAPPAAVPQRYYLSPGPIAECDFAVPDFWRCAAAFYACGFRAGMLLHNCFSYHFTPAGFMCDEGARQIGGCVFPAGAGNSEQQARAVAQLRPQCYSGTPDFLHTVLTRADETGCDVTSLTMGCVSGGYLSPQLRDGYAARGIKVLQWYGSADVGCIAYETIVGEPLVVSEGLLVEVTDPITRQPCAAGEKGEVLITNFNPHYPLLRLALGDLSATAPGTSPCGRSNRRLVGWLGRCDAAVKVRGMFVHPVQVERLLKKCADLARVQLAVSHDENKRDTLQLRCVLQNGVTATPALTEQLMQALQDETKLRGDISVVDAVDGGVICDER